LPHTLFAAACGVCIAQQAPAPSAPVTLFQNVRVFDGKSGALSGPTNVLVKGQVIARISADPIAIEPGTSAPRSSPAMAAR
jgi:hypothetical protein